MNTLFDVIVCGGGHAGCEAAWIAAQKGVSVLLITQNLDTIAQMSCNPSIGGLAKGHIVREIDALGGLMGINADETAIQFRILNRSKGLAVQAPRAQCDKKCYQISMKQRLEQHPNIRLFQDEVVDLLVKENRICGRTENNFQVRDDIVITDENKDDILKMLSFGVPKTLIAKQYNTSVGNLYNFLKQS